MRVTKKIISIAKVSHQANKSFCEANNDPTQKDWENAPEWQRKSAVQGVVFRLENPKANKSAQHDAWSKAKLKDGWEFGKVKDEKKKTHPCLVAFSKLPIFQQKKDALFQSIVDSLK